MLLPEQTSMEVAIVVSDSRPMKKRLKEAFQLLVVLCISWGFITGSDIKTTLKRSNKAE